MCENVDFVSYSIAGRLLLFYIEINFAKICNLRYEFNVNLMLNFLVISNYKLILHLRRPHFSGLAIARKTGKWYLMVVTGTVKK